MTLQEQFLRGYIECALWSSTDESDPETGGEPLDKNYSASDIAPETLAAMNRECLSFMEANENDLVETCTSGRDWTGYEQHGHDFWLTRNGHGAGFWDRGYGEAGKRLTKSAEACGERCLYVGDDGRIYQAPS